MIKSFFLNKKWAMWAGGGFLFIIGSLLAQTWIDVKINEWYKGFYDLLQKASESDVAEFYDGKKVSFLFPGLLASGKTYPIGKDMFLLNYMNIRP